VADLSLAFGQGSDRPLSSRIERRTARKTPRNRGPRGTAAGHEEIRPTSDRHATDIRPMLGPARDRRADTRKSTGIHPNPPKNRGSQRPAYTPNSARFPENPGIPRPGRDRHATHRATRKNPESARIHPNPRNPAARAGPGPRAARTRGTPEIHGFPRPAPNQGFRPAGVCTLGVEGGPGSTINKYFTPTESYRHLSRATFW
jgi:hypothetical protein